jgi:UDP-2,4-diacetamido-2,4,6-trideoxy-beta-L-altropyranose hydrolase
MSSRKLTLRTAGPEDCERVWIWRNDPETRLASLDDSEVPWTVHVEWFAAVQADPERVLLIGELEGQPLAVVRFDRLGGDSWEASINLDPARRGHGWGTQILQLAIDWASSQLDVQSFVARAKESNARSLRIFQNVGFSVVFTRAGVVTLRWTAPSGQ